MWYGSILSFVLISCLLSLVQLSASWCCLLYIPICVCWYFCAFWSVLKTQVYVLLVLCILVAIVLYFQFILELLGIQFVAG